uniref:MATH domain-containing protein n=1 Tax=Salix viminalis TaxID=40686 RepID=A0A6N2MEJ5_SALVM
MLKDLLIGSTVEFDPSLSKTGPLRTAEFLGFEIFGKYQKTKMGLEVMKKKLKEEEKEAMEKVTVGRYGEEERHVAPAHYSMKIDSFSLLSEMVDNSYESREFEASGYKWKLVLYPNGDKSRNGDGYISLYLTPLVSLLVGKSMPSSDGTFTLEVQKFSELTEEFYYCQEVKALSERKYEAKGQALIFIFGLDDHTKFHAGWKLFVEFTLRIRDQVWSHHHEKTLRKLFDASVVDVWGLASFISLTDIKNQSNNFIVNDTLIVEGVLL